MNTTSNHETLHTSESAVEAAAVHEQHRSGLIDSLKSEALDLDSADAYDAYAELVDSIRDSARTGEFTTSAQDEPLSEEQILEQMILAFDARNGAIDTQGVKWSNFLPRAGGLRMAVVGLIGERVDGGDSSPHTAVLEGMVREAYDAVTHPEAAALTSSEPEEKVSPVIEADPVVTPLKFSTEIENSAEEDVEQDAAVEGDDQERDIKHAHERDVRSIAEELTTTLNSLARRVEEVEDAGGQVDRRHHIAIDSLQDMLNSTRRFEDLPVDGIRTMVRRMRDDLYSHIGAMRRDEMSLMEDFNRATNAANVQLAESKDWAEATDNKVENNLLMIGADTSTYDIESRGASAVYAVAQDAAESISEVARALDPIAEDSRTDAEALVLAERQLSEITERTSYRTDMIDADEVRAIITNAITTLQSVDIQRHSSLLRQASDQARQLLRKAASHISER